MAAAAEDAAAAALAAAQDAAAAGAGGVGAAVAGAGAAGGAGAGGGGAAALRPAAGAAREEDPDLIRMAADLQRREQERERRANERDAEMKLMMEQVLAGQRTVAKAQTAAPPVVQALTALIEAMAELEPASRVLRALASATHEISAIQFGPAPTADSVKEMYDTAKSSITAAAITVPDDTKRKQSVIRAVNGLKAIYGPVNNKRKATDDGRTSVDAQAGGSVAATAAATAPAAAAAAAAGAGAGAYSYRYRPDRVRTPCSGCGSLNHYPRNCPELQASGLRFMMQQQANFQYPGPVIAYSSGHGGNANGGSGVGNALAPAAAATSANWCADCAAAGRPFAHTHRTSNCNCKQQQMQAQERRNACASTSDASAYRVPPAAVGASSPRRDAGQVPPAAVDELRARPNPETTADYREPKWH